MSDIFRIDTSDGIKLTGGVQQEGICTTTDSRDVRTRTELESGAQNAGGNDSSPNGGISEVYVSGCLTGSGTEANPVSIVIDPTGGISCGPNGLLVTNLVVVTGVTASSVVTSGCLTGSGTPSNPITVLLNPTGGLQCTVGGIALQTSYLTSIVSSGCLTGSGTTASPVVLAVNPTGGIHCTAAGIALQQTYLTQAITSGCIGGVGTAGSPIVLSINPTGGLQCTPGGLATQLSVSGCLSGVGSATSPFTVLLNPTGGLHCTPNGVAINATIASSVVVSGCLSGSGTVSSPVLILLNPTGGLQCTANGLAISQSLLSSTGGICTAWSYESGTAPLSPTQPTTPLTNLSSGNVQVEVYNNLIRFWFYNGSSFVLDKEFSGGGSGTGTPASPVNSVQFNNAGSFGGSSNFIWDGSTLSVTGNVTAKNVANLVYTIVDGTGVDINPSNGGFQVWTLGSGRVPTANSFAQGQSVTLLLDDGSGYNVDWTTIGVNWLGGTAPVLATSGYTVVDLFKIGSTVYGLSTTSGTTGTGTPASPVNSIQYNSAGAFAGSSGLMFDGTNLSVTGVITTKNVTTVVHTITDGTGVNINPASGSLQLWTLGATRTPSASSFDHGQAVTLMISGAGNTVNWSTINPVWVDGANPYLPATGFGIVELWKVGSTIYGASLASGVASAGGGTPASPVNSVQFNSAGSFGGSSNLLWTGSELSVTGVVSTKNVNSTVYTITDGTGVDIDPDNGGIQVWVLTSGRTPTASSFDQGQSVTLMIDDGSGYTVNWGTIGVNWLAGSAPTLATSGYTVVELWKVGSTIYGASSVDVASSSGSSPGGSDTQVQFNNAGSFGGAAGLTWNGTGVTISGASLTASSPALTLAQTWNSGTVAFTGVLVNINDTSSSSSSKLLDFKANGTSVAAVIKHGLFTGAGLHGNSSVSMYAGTGGGGFGSAIFTVNSSNIAILEFGSLQFVDTILTREATHVLAQRNGTNSQGFRLYNNYISAGVYERGVMDWIGSPGVLQIGTQHAGSGVPRGLQLITSGTPRIDIQAGGAIQFYGAYTFPSTNGSSGQVLTTNGAGTLAWGNVSGAATSDYFTGETNDGNSGSSITINFGTKANHKLTLTNNCTLTFTAPADARETKIRFVQGGVGGYSITLPSGTLGDTPVLPTGVGAQSVVRFYYDGDGVWHV